VSWEKPFHEGELKAQKLAGETAEAEANSAMIDGEIMAGALNFVRGQEMAVAGSRDEKGRRWASFLFGRKGFLQPIDRKTLRIDLDPAEIDADDPLWKNIEGDAKIGLLVIELATRRRLRINGQVHRIGDTLELEVLESYPNCPKYITRRQIKFSDKPSGASKPLKLRGSQLNEQQQEIIRVADTLFMATGHPKRGADASHRGGRPGFVQIIDDATLRIPDYSGNSMFNTFGNLLVDPHVGLLIPEFEADRALQITGTAKIEWHDKDPEDASGGTHRFVVIRLDEWREHPLPVAVKSTFIDYSPYDP
jgi:uncharacterized protein